MSDKQLPAETSPSEAAIDPADKWRALWWLPCELSLQLPLTQFTVRELLRLRSGSIVTTACSRSTEVPVYANGQLIGWTEFDVVGDHVGARITELV